MITLPYYIIIRGPIGPPMQALAEHALTLVMKSGVILDDENIAYTSTSVCSNVAALFAAELKESMQSLEELTSQVHVMVNVHGSNMGKLGHITTQITEDGADLALTANLTQNDLKELPIEKLAGYLLAVACIEVNKKVVQKYQKTNQAYNGLRTGCIAIIGILGLSLGAFIYSLLN